MVKLSMALAAFLFVVPALAQSLLPQSVECLDHPRVECASQIHVISGDTFEMNGETIRLWGIEAPESDHPCLTIGEIRIEGAPVRIALHPGSGLLERLANAVTHCERLGEGR